MRILRMAPRRRSPLRPNHWKPKPGIGMPASCASFRKKPTDLRPPARRSDAFFLSPLHLGGEGEPRSGERAARDGSPGLDGEAGKHSWQEGEGVKDQSTRWPKAKPRDTAICPATRTGSRGRGNTPTT